MGGRLSKKSKSRKSIEISPFQSQLLTYWLEQPLVISNINDNENEDEDPSFSEESSRDTNENEDEDPSFSEESSREEKKRFDTHDPTLIFVCGDDELDFECNDFKGPRARMSCGHAATPMSVTRWCRRQLDEGECKFVCGLTDCDVEWSFEEVCKMALLTPKEMQYFEKKMFSNAKKLMGIKECPGCKSHVERDDLNNLKVHCRVCTAAKGRTYTFCWQCLRKWKGPSPRSDRCENIGCQNPVAILRTCPEIVFKDVKGVIGCPSIRACPTCGLLLQHSKENCKTIVCTQCKVKFCFVCLSFSKKCLQQNAYEACPTAPRQTSIPVWRRPPPPPPPPPPPLPPMPPPPPPYLSSFISAAQIPPRPPNWLRRSQAMRRSRV